MIFQLATRVRVHQEVVAVPVLQEPGHDVVEVLGREEDGPLGGRERSDCLPVRLEEAELVLVEEVSALVAQALGEELGEPVPQLERTLGVDRVFIPVEDVDVPGVDFGGFFLIAGFVPVDVVKGGVCRDREQKSEKHERFHKRFMGMQFRAEVKR